tara:strand:+ start:444 stop:734 length:291 start_codon:yes stop_codon:yes gene_type:complete
VVTHSRKIPDATTPNKNNRVLLEAMALTRDIGCNFDPVSEAHTGHFPKGRVRFLGSLSTHLGANSTLLGGTTSYDAGKAALVGVVVEEQRRSTRLL